MKILITGGAGFIGSNIAAYYMNKADVVIIDNLSRKGVEFNLKWLKNIGRFEFVKADIRDRNFIFDFFKKNNVDVIFHQAAQVAVTTSVKDPAIDFEINASGSFNLLEAARIYAPDAIFVYSSTNKVYGELSHLEVIEKEKRYEFKDEKYRYGIDENMNLDFHSPYGCSKGAVDQYVRDYNRIYGLRTIVFRQSCIYGLRQIGIEDQGWVAWFIIRCILNKPVTIYGTGKQVRDILYIDDLIRAYDLAIKNIDTTAGRIYNTGGGYKNSLSLLEFISILEELSGKKMDYSFSDWRPGDQKIFISDNSMLKKDLNWEPLVDYKTGIKKLYDWVKENRSFIEFFV